MPAKTFPPPFILAIQNAFRDSQPGDMLPHWRIDAGAGGLELHAVNPAVSGGRVVNVAGDAALGVTWKQEIRIVRCALGRTPDVDARFTQTLHGLQADHQARSEERRVGKECRS